VKKEKRKGEKKRGENIKERQGGHQKGWKEKIP
jgi:hypothetical protein